MRKLAIVLALSTTALATPALARDKAWYIGVEEGAMLVEDIHYDVGATKNAVTAEHRAGIDADGTIGYDFGAFRLEAEVGYKLANMQHLTTTVPLVYYAGAGGTAPRNSATGYYPRPGGRTSVLSAMVNGLLDFGDDDHLQGFVGGGVGIARVKADAYRLTNNGPFLDDSDSVFAYQGLAGIRAPLNKSIDLTLKYRFFSADGVKLVDAGTVGGTPRTFHGRFRSHSILGGVTMNFGGPTPPPPPPPAEVAPPPPPPLPPPPPVVTPVVCSPAPVIVFFDWDKSDILPSEAGKLDGAAQTYQQCGNATVVVAGFADRSGTTAYNVGLSQRRADAVKAYLSAHAIPDGAITTQAFGEDPAHLLVQTADGVREPQNRRVEVTIGAQAGQ